MLVLPGEVHNLRHFGFRDLVCENTAFADAVLMHVHHDPMRRFAVFIEEALEDVFA